MSRCFRCHLTLRYYRLRHVSPPCQRVRTCMCNGHTCACMPLSYHINISLSFWILFRRGWGQKKSGLLISHLFLQLLIMTPPPFYSLSLSSLSFVLDFGSLDSTSISSPPSSFSVLKYNQECGKLEGDLEMCLSRGMEARKLDFHQAWGRGWGPGPLPKVLQAGLAGC